VRILLVGVCPKLVAQSHQVAERRACLAVSTAADRQDGADPTEVVMARRSRGRTSVG